MASVSRISTPTFDKALVFWFWITRATIDPSPVSVWWAKRKESAVPLTSAPEPDTVNVPVAAS